MSLRFKYTTTLTDYNNFVEAVRNYLRTGYVNKKYKYNFYLSIFLYSIALLLLIVLANKYLKWDFDVASFLIGFWCYVFVAQSAYRKHKTLVKPKKNCDMYGEREMILDDAKFTIISENSTVTMSWKIVCDIQEDTIYLYYLTPGEAFISLNENWVLKNILLK